MSGSGRRPCVLLHAVCFWTNFSLLISLSPQQLLIMNTSNDRSAVSALTKLSCKLLSIRNLDKNCSYEMSSGLNKSFENSANWMNLLPRDQSKSSLYAMTGFSDTPWIWAAFRESRSCKKQAENFLSGTQCVVSQVTLQIHQQREETFQCGISVKEI